MALSEHDEGETCTHAHSNTPIAIAELPFSQRDFWRHRCAACAYELGRAVGRDEALAEARAKVLQVFGL